MRKSDHFKYSISRICSHLPDNHEHHSRPPGRMSDSSYENSVASTFWRSKVSRRAFLALRNINTKKKCFSNQITVPYRRGLTNHSDLASIECQNLPTISHQEETAALSAAMKIVMRKWTAGIVRRFVLYVHRLYCHDY